MKRRRWTKAEIDIVRKLYADHPTARIAKRLRRSVSSVYQASVKLGLAKTPEFIRDTNRKLGKRLARTESARRHRFPKGHVPANKGLRRPGWHAGRMRETQFKKGHFPANRDPDFYVIGALRINSYGYIDMRVSFDKGALAWKGLHLILWEDAHGPMPAHHCLRFKDGDCLNVCLENLECISRRENLRRNSIHRLPGQLKSIINLLGQFKRRIREKQDRRSA